MAEERHFVRYAFYKAEPSWRRLPPAERAAGAEEFLNVAESFADDMMVRSYNLQGTRGDVDFMLWQATRRLETLQDLAIKLSATGLGRYLATPHSYLAITRRSPYVDDHRHSEQESGLVPRPKGAAYLFVYPFWKTRPWYLESKERRQAMMNKHFEIGHKYPSVKINTGYSFGLDDQEFVVAFETEAPGDFLDLVAELRETETSLFTLRDTPIFTCVRMDLKDVVDSLAI
jgi:chlorite dismutase